MLTAAGCNYFMGVPMGDDSMLSYQCTSYHDAPTLRQLFKARPAAEFETWMVDLGLMKDGILTEKAGDPTFFLKHKNRMTRNEIMIGVNKWTMQS